MWFCQCRNCPASLWGCGDEGCLNEPFRYLITHHIAGDGDPNEKFDDRRWQTIGARHQPSRVS